MSMWEQADMNIMELQPMEENGWCIENDELKVVWDTKENLEKIKDLVQVRIYVWEKYIDYGFSHPPTHLDQRMQVRYRLQH